MAEKKSIDKLIKLLPKRNVIVIFVGIGLVVAYVLLGIVPNQTKLTRLSKSMENKNFELEEQKILYPLYTQVLVKSQLKKVDGLPFPDKVQMPHAEIKQLPFRFQKIVESCDLKFEGSEPDVSTLGLGSKFLRISLDLSGDFFKIQNLLIRLGEITYYEGIEDIKISSNNDGIKKIKINLWLSLAK